MFPTTRKRRSTALSGSSAILMTLSDNEDDDIVELSGDEDVLDQDTDIR